ncbi:MFS transporter [Tistrella mobilis]|uniref:MFS transporter n=1 Tax=Tistrella mobilis TaxID=171437 RepID=UPI0016519443|nr:MFS transporter [Tistrella mobilis]
MSSPPAIPETARRTADVPRAVTVMLGLLVAGFALSHLYRTLPAVMAGPLQAGFGIGAEGLGVFAAAFHLAFALVQLPVGLAVDRLGVRRTATLLLLITAAGAAASAVAPAFGWLVAAQAVIGIGCSGLLMAPLVFASHAWPAERFAAVSGAVVSIGGAGMLLSGTPLSLAIELGGWRGAFAACSVLTLIVAAAIHLGLARAPVPARPPVAAGAAGTRLVEDIRGTLAILISPAMRGTAALALISYPALITLRGLWLGPFLDAAYGLDAVTIGNIVLVVSAVMVVAPLGFGRADRPGHRRRLLMTGGGLLAAAALAALGLIGGRMLALDLALTGIAVAAGSFYVLQFAVVRASFPPETMGRALAGLIFCFFAGVAVWQVATGVIAGASGAGAGAADLEGIRRVFLVLGLALGIVSVATGRGRPAAAAL